MVKKFAQQVTPTRVDLVWLNAAVWDNSAPRVVHLGLVAVVSGFPGRRIGRAVSSIDGPAFGGGEEEALESERGNDLLPAEKSNSRLSTYTALYPKL
jgi:hypothetical protein